MNIVAGKMQIICKGAAQTSTNRPTRQINQIQLIRKKMLPLKLLQQHNTTKNQRG